MLCHVTRACRKAIEAWAAVGKADAKCQQHPNGLALVSGLVMADFLRRCDKPTKAPTTAPTVAQVGNPCPAGTIGDCDAPRTADGSGAATIFLGLGGAVAALAVLLL